MPTTSQVPLLSPTHRTTQPHELCLDNKKSALTNVPEPVFIFVVVITIRAFSSTAEFKKQHHGHYLI